MTKQTKNSSFFKKRLRAADIKNYLKEVYKEEHIAHIIDKGITNYTPLDQDDYGDDLDCSLTSITSVLLPRTNKTDKEVYNIVEAVAKKYGYEGKKKGTNPLFIKKILVAAAKKLGIKTNAYVLYGTNLYWSFQTVKKLVAKNKPSILSLYKDNRGYYEDHTVTIVGYIEVVTAEGHVYHFLKVADNWYKTMDNLIDYKLLGVISNLVHE